ncbi:MAG: Transcriptional regulator, ArsR family [Bacilli bacterium]|jgi:ArsR family transcriptional regulator|nr:Transcriptional regulator, ArsR family [Bacilli bacterium]
MDLHSCDNKMILEKFTQSTSVLQALGDFNRQEIISHLIEMTSLNVTQITERMKISRPAISHHLKILRQANLVDCVRNGKERFYSLSPKINESLKILKDLIEAVEAQQ